LNLVLIKVSFCNESYPNVNGKDKSVYINFINSLYLDVKTEKKHHVCFTLKLVYLREEDWKKL